MLRRLLEIGLGTFRPTRLRAGVDGSDTPGVVLTHLRLNGVRMKIVDFGTSCVCRVVARELRKDAYLIESIDFLPGDVVLDIGANVGIVAIYLALKHPAVTVHSFEPVPENYAHLVRNIALNGVGNIVPHNLAVTKDGRSFEMAVHFASNSGGATGHLHDLHLPGHAYRKVDSTTLDRILADIGGARCRLLKIDCEGTEHEILLNSRSLHKVEYLSGEFHINEHLRRCGYTLEGLLDHCRRFIDPSKLRVSTTHMAE